MQEYPTSAIRNVALVPHNGAGKTTLVERLLFDTGATTRMGSVQAGTAVMDFEDEEKARNSSVSLAVAPIEWKDVKINVLDTPGYIEFVGEVNSPLRVVEGALVLDEAVAGVEVGTELSWQAAGDIGLPRVILVNKMNRENVRTACVLSSIKDNLDGRFVQLQVPVGEGPTFKGVVDLISMQARLGNKDEPATELQFEVSNGCNVTITLYDEVGKLLQTLFNEKAEAGKHTISINTSDLQSGNYHIILNNGKTMLETTLEILQ